MFFVGTNSMHQKMCKRNFVLCCCTLFLLISLSSSKPQKNYMNNEGKDDNLTKRYELNVDSTINYYDNYSDKMKTLQYNLYEKSTNNTQNNEHHTNSTSNNRKDDDSEQYEFGKNSINNHESDNKMMELQANLTNFNSKKNFTSSRTIYRDLMKMKGNKNFTLYNKTFNRGDNKYNIIPYKMCDNITCIQLCCPLGDRLIDDKCISAENKTLTPLFPSVYEHIKDSLQNESKRIDELFHLVVHDPCQKNQHTHYLLDSNSKNYSEYKYIFFNNGSLYLLDNHTFVEAKSYCLANMQQNEFEIIICSEEVNQEKNNKKSKEEGINILYLSEEGSTQKIKKEKYINLIIYMSLYIVSTIILLATLLVYSVLPELRNTHGFMLCMYSGFRIAANIFDIMNILINQVFVICISNIIYIAFVSYFCSLASYFWLNVMSFDMWWTFKKLNFLQRNMKKREKRKLIMYSIYAWGFPCILTIVCVIVNNISNVPERFRWFITCGKSGYMAFLLYFYMPKSICTVSNVYLSIFVALKIRRYEKDAVNNLRDSESQYYNENKKWFNMYLKLFIMVFIIIGIQWCTQISYLFYALDHQHNQLYKDIVMYTLFLSDFLINLGNFIIFVCKKKIMRLLLKRFGCQNLCTLSLETRNKADTTSSSTCITTSGDISMPKKIGSCEKANSHEIHFAATRL